MSDEGYSPDIRSEIRYIELVDHFTSGTEDDWNLYPNAAKYLVTFGPNPGRDGTIYYIFDRKSFSNIFSINIRDATQGYPRSISFNIGELCGLYSEGNGYPCILWLSSIAATNSQLVLDAEKALLDVSDDIFGNI